MHKEIILKSINILRESLSILIYMDIEIVLIVYIFCPKILF